jgi:acetyl-CoA carboxylase biotin carboxyl carrier protein
MPAKFDLDSDFVRKLAKLLEETGLSEIEYAEGDKKIRCAISRGGAVPAAAIAVSAPAGDAASTVLIGEVTSANGTSVTSPMVGTAYLASGSGNPPFVKIGDKVKEGDTLLVIEAMKVMNPIKAPKSGTIAEILVGNAKPVEFGETLIVIA